MTAKTLLDGAGASFSADLNLALGRLAAGSSKSVALATDDSTNLATIATAAADTTTPSPVRLPGSYEAVAASQTDQVMGATGATGDYLSHLLIVPATTAPGAVSIKDGAGSAITVFAGGTLPSVISFPVACGGISAAGAWKVTTGGNVSVIAFGKFT